MILLAIAGIETIPVHNGSSFEGPRCPSSLEQDSASLSNEYLDFFSDLGLGLYLLLDLFFEAELFECIFLNFIELILAAIKFLLMNPKSW